MKKELIPVGFLNFVNTLNFAIMIPVLPFVVRVYGGGPFIYGILLAIYPIFQFFSAPLLGTLSDYFGRRPILLISQAGTMLSWVIILIACFVPHIYLGFVSLPILLFVLGRISDGATGGNSSVANAYLVDITTHEEKTKAFGIMGGIMGLGLIIGPVVGGLSMETELGFVLPIIITLLISVITLIIMYFFLPESLQEVNRTKRLNFDLAKELQFLPKIKPYVKDRKLKYNLFLRTVFLFVYNAFSSVIILFVIEKYEFTSKGVGIFFTFAGALLIFNQVFVSGWMSRHIGDMKTMLIGQMLLVISQIAFVIGTRIWLFLPFAVICNLGFSISMPTFKALLSKGVEESKQGEIMGIDESIFSATAAIAPIIATWLFSMIGQQVFIVQSLLIVCALLVYRLRKGWLPN